MKCYIKLKSFNYIILENIFKLCLLETIKTKLVKTSLIRLPNKSKKFSLIKSPHVHKKSREQLETLDYNRILLLEGPKEVLEKIISKNIIYNKRAFFFQIKWQY
jgi:small subunit ribosomal protein S10